MRNLIKFKANAFYWIGFPRRDLLTQEGTDGDWSQHRFREELIPLDYCAGLHTEVLNEKAQVDFYTKPSL